MLAEVRGEPVSIAVEGTTVVVSCALGFTPEQFHSALAAQGLTGAEVQLVDYEIEDDGTEFLVLTLISNSGGGANERSAAHQLQPVQ